MDDWNALSENEKYTVWSMAVILKMTEESYFAYCTRLENE